MTKLYNKTQHKSKILPKIYPLPENKEDKKKWLFFNFNRQPWLYELQARLAAQRQREAEQARQAAEAQKALEAQRQRELEALLQAQAQTRAMILNQAFVSTPPPKQKSTQPKSA